MFWRREQADAVIEAAIRSKMIAEDGVYFVGYASGRNLMMVAELSDSVMDRFADDPRVRRISKAERQHNGHYLPVDAVTGESGTIVKVGDIAWHSRSRVSVGISIEYEHGGESSSTEFHHDGTEWKPVSRAP